MKQGHSFAIALLALALAACGGNGGKDGNTDVEPVGLTITPRIEAVLSDLSLDPGFPYQDLLNLQTGDAVTFQLVNYSGSGSSLQRNVLPAESFRTSDTTNVAGSLSTSNGVFRAANNDTGSRQFIIAARYQGVDYPAFYRINPRQIRLRGKVLAEGTNQPVYNAVIDFYARRNPLDAGSSQVVVQTVRTGFDGTFRVSLPAFNDSVDTVAEAKAAANITFTIRNSELPDGFYSSFVFQGLRYEAGSSVCRATLLSEESVTDDDGTAFLPFRSGDRYLVNTGEDNATNGTILLTPSSLFETKPDSNGCSVALPEG